jgi:hypothetical protein
MRWTNSTTVSRLRRPGNGKRVRDVDAVILITVGRKRYGADDAGRVVSGWRPELAYHRLGQRRA